MTGAYNNEATQAKLSISLWSRAEKRIGCVFVCMVVIDVFRVGWFKNFARLFIFKCESYASDYALQHAQTRLYMWVMLCCMCGAPLIYIYVFFDKDIRLIVCVRYLLTHTTAFSIVNILYSIFMHFEYLDYASSVWRIGRLVSVSSTSCLIIVSSQHNYII